MANEEKKDLNSMLHNSKDLPEITEIKDEAGILKWGWQVISINE